MKIFLKVTLLLIALKCVDLVWIKMSETSSQEDSDSIWNKIISSIDPSGESQREERLREFLTSNPDRHLLDYFTQHTWYHHPSADSTNRKELILDTKQSTKDHVVLFGYFRHSNKDLTTESLHEIEIVIEPLSGYPDNISVTIKFNSFGDVLSSTRRSDVITLRDVAQVWSNERVHLTTYKGVAGKSQNSFGLPEWTIRYWLQENESGVFLSENTEEGISFLVQSEQIRYSGF